MNKIIVFALLIIFGIAKSNAQRNFDKQAHRGGAGLMPENSIIAAKNALSLGATIEMDLYISKDNQLVVSHDPHINSLFALYPDGKSIPKEEENNLKMNQLDYAEIKKFDIGSKPYSVYPQQKKISTYYPLFSELIDSAEVYAKANHLGLPKYNIQPGPAYTITDSFRTYFVKEMMDIILTRKIQKRSMFQSFDIGMLETVHRDYPNIIKTVFLVGASRKDFEGNLKKLSFKPDIYSPYYTLVTKELVDKCHKMKMKIIPWTVNAKEVIDKLKAMGVDGIISDYPELL